MTTSPRQPETDAAVRILVYGVVFLAAMWAFGLIFCPPAKADDDPLLRWGTPEGTVVVDIPHHLCHAFDGQSRTARWVLEYLTPRVVNGSAERRKLFKADSRIPLEFRPVLADFQAARNDDRGHLAPCDDFGFSQDWMDLTFNLWNMTPQDKALNEVFWNNEIERKVRNLVTPNSQVWVCTSPVFASSGELLRVHQYGENKVWEPTHYIKTALVLHDKELPERLFCWLVPNQTPDLGLKADDFVCSVDFAERMRGLDFWSGLPSGLQEELEGRE